MLTVENVIVGTTAGQIIAAIADIEMAYGQWNELIPTLLEMLTGSPSPVAKKSTLQCIGFICEVVVSDLHLQSNLMYYRTSPMQS